MTRQEKNMTQGPSAEPGLLAKLLTLIAGVILLVLGFMFSVVLVAIIAVAGLVAGGYFWWKTRKLRQAVRQHPPGGRVIDGEVIVVDDFPDQDGNARPRGRSGDLPPA
jgi:UPF0716 family protein affecting phage T7 exclusion